MSAKTYFRNIFIATACASVLAATPAQAQGWSFNLGFNNPPGASIGANFMHLWDHFAIELGIGWLNLSSTSANNNGGTNSSSLSVAGDANLKYLFGIGGFRPYLQGGFGIGTGATIGSDSSAGAGTGQGFVGAGFFAMGQSIYAYLSANLAAAQYGFFQAGIGFNF